MAAIDFKTLSDEQLVHHELSLERQLIESSFRHRTSQLDDMSKLKKLRRQIARIRTEERTREIAAGVGTDSLRNRFRGSFKAGALSAQVGGAGGFLKGISESYGLSDGDQSE